MAKNPEELSPRQKDELAAAAHRLQKANRSIGQIITQKVKVIRQRGEEAQELKRTLMAVRWLDYQLRHFGLISRPEHPDVGRLFDYLTNKLGATLAVGADIEKLKNDAWKQELAKIKEIYPEGVAQVSTIRDLAERVHLLNEQIADMGRIDADISHLLYENEELEAGLERRDAFIESLSGQLRQSLGHVDALRENDYAVRRAYVEQFFRALKLSHQLKRAKRGMYIDRLLSAVILGAAGVFGVLWYLNREKPAEVRYVQAPAAQVPEEFSELSDGVFTVKFGKEWFRMRTDKWLDCYREIDKQYGKNSTSAQRLEYFRSRADKARYIKDEQKEK